MLLLPVTARARRRPDLQELPHGCTPRPRARPGRALTAMSTRRPGTPSTTAARTAGRTIELVRARPVLDAGTDGSPDCAVTEKSGLDGVPARPGDEPVRSGRVPAGRETPLRGATPVPHASGTLGAALQAAVTALRAEGPTAVRRTALTGLLDAWAAALVDLHARPVGAGVSPVARPWVLEHETLPRWLGDLPAEAGRAWAVQAHPRVRRALRDARDGWTGAQWVHDGDVDDVLVDPVAAGGAPADPATAGGVPSPRAARVAHVRASGRGDARWDVASALDWIAVTLVPALDDAWAVDPVTSFMAAYRERGGRAEPTRALAVARVVTTAIEQSLLLEVEAAPGSGSGSDQLVWLAALWGRPLALVGAARRD